MAAPRLNIGRATAVGKSSRRIAAVEHDAVIFAGKALATPVYERGDLRPGQSLNGPAVVTEYSATTVIPPGQRFCVGQAENLIIDVGGKRGR